MNTSDKIFHMLLSFHGRSRLWIYNNLNQLAFLYEYGPANWNELHEIKEDTVIYRTREDEDEGSGEILDDLIAPE